MLPLSTCERGLVLCLHKTGLGLNKMFENFIIYLL